MANLTGILREESIPYPRIAIHVLPCSGKLRSGWRLPPGASSKVVNAMHKGLRGAIGQVLTGSMKTPESDFVPSDDGPTDEFWLLTPEFKHMMIVSPYWR